MVTIKEHLTHKFSILVAFLLIVLFEWVKITAVLIGIWGIVIVADLTGLKNNIGFVLLHEISLVGVIAIYLCALVYDAIDFYKLFNKR